MAGGQTRNGVAALIASNVLGADATGGVSAWDGNVSGDVFAIAVSGSNVYVGGRFTTVKGTMARDHFAAFDTGGNLLSVTNNLCGGPCAMISGIPVALLNGASAANVSIGAAAIQNASLGSLKLGTPNTALISVSGAASKVTIGPK